MLGNTDGKNLRDSSTDVTIPIKDNLPSISYSKTNKLIMALYMVTDILDRDEPIRHKLRFLGSEIVSDIHSTPMEATRKITEVLSFLSIARAMSIVSEMNHNILHKEFSTLHQSIQEFEKSKHNWLGKFLIHGESNQYIDAPKLTTPERNSTLKSIGHKSFYNGQASTRIGVQRGGTLMKALSDKTTHLSFTNRSNNINRIDSNKKDRQEKIVRIIKDNDGNASIKDIKDKINLGSPEQTYSEKTLQRELLSMTKDGLLTKTGEKRWSRYFTKK